jgi:hypothetical protein
LVQQAVDRTQSDDCPIQFLKISKCGRKDQILEGRTGGVSRRVAASDDQTLEQGRLILCCGQERRGAYVRADAMHSGQNPNACKVFGRIAPMSDGESTSARPSD